MNDTQLIHTMMSLESDGSLPEVTLLFSNDINKFGAISSIIHDSNPNLHTSIWDESIKSDVSCKGMSKKELCNRLSDGHHILIRELGAIPDLGMSIFENGLSFDFRTGLHWSQPAVNEFISFLKHLVKRFDVIKITLDDEGEFFAPEDIEFFNLKMNRG